MDWRKGCQAGTSGMLSAVPQICSSCNCMHARSHQQCVAQNWRADCDGCAYLDSSTLTCHRLHDSRHAKSAQGRGSLPFQLLVVARQLRLICEHAHRVLPEDMSVACKHGTYSDTPTMSSPHDNQVAEVRTCFSCA